MVSVQLEGSYTLHLLIPVYLFVLAELLRMRLVLSASHAIKLAPNVMERLLLNVLSVVTQQ